MELIFRQRPDRPEKAGRTTVFGDLHWAVDHRWKVPPLKRKKALGSV